jgi:hypothetical protein
MDILETLRRVGYATPSLTWAQMRTKIFVDDLSSTKRKHATLYSADDTIAILQRWVEFKKSGKLANSKETREFVEVITKEIADISLQKEGNKRKREEAGLDGVPELLPRHVQLHREGYGFLVLWQVSAVAYKKKALDPEKGEEASEGHGDLSAALQFRVAKYETAKAMSDLIAQHLSAANLPDVIVKPSKHVIDFASKNAIFENNLKKASDVMKTLRPLLQALQADEGPAVFHGNLHPASPKLFVFMAGCSPQRPNGEDKREVRTTGDVTDMMYMKLASVIHANGHEMIILAGRHCGSKCQEYRKKPRHAGKCDRFDGPENELNSVRFKKALQGEFEEDYIAFCSKGVETKASTTGYLRYIGEKVIVLIFMGQHAASCLESVQLMEMQHTLPHGYCPHFSTCNELSNAEKIAGVLAAFGIPVKAEDLKLWWLETNRLNKVHERGILTLVANSHANSVDSAYKIRLDEKTPNGKDVYVRCTACDSKFFHGNWTLHVKTKEHKKSMAAITSASSSSQPSESTVVLSHASQGAGAL